MQKSIIIKIKSFFMHDLTIKIISLLFGLLLWLLASSNVKYEYITSLPLQLEGLPEGLVAVTDLPRQIKVKMVGQGRELFQLNFGKPIAHLRILKPEIGKNYQHITPESIILPTDYEITLEEVIEPTNIVIDFDEIAVKKVPVIVPTYRQLLPDLELKQPISWHPKYIIASGPSTILKTLNQVLSDTLDLSSIIVSENRSLKINRREFHDYFSFNPDSIMVEIQIEQILTFEYANVGVRLLNGNDDKIDFTPHFVTVKIRVPESKSRPYKDINSDELVVSIDARSFRNNPITLSPLVQSHGDLFKKAVMIPPSIQLFSKDPK